MAATTAVHAGGLKRNAMLSSRSLTTIKFLQSGEHTTSGCSCRNGVLISGTISSGNECTYHMYQWIEQHSTDPDHLHDTPFVVW